MIIESPASPFALSGNFNTACQ